MASDDTRLDRIESKIDKVADTQVRQEVTLATNTQSLTDHMKRTELLEEAIIPLRRRADKLDGIISLIGGIIALCAACEGIVAVIELIRSLHPHV